MNSPAPVAEVQTNLPSRATVGGGILGGIALAPLIVWLLGQFSVDMPGEVAAIVGGLISNIVGYFFEGGRAYKEVPMAQAGFARIGMLIALAFVAAFVMTGCSITPADVVKTPCEAKSEYRVERCVKAVLETSEVYQQRALDLKEHPSTPEEVKSLIRKASAYYTSVVEQLAYTTKAYMQVRDDLKAGSTTEEQLAIATARVYDYIDLLNASIDGLKNALAGKPTPDLGITTDAPLAVPAAASVDIR